MKKVYVKQRCEESIEITIMATMRQHIRVLGEGAGYSKSGSRESWLAVNNAMNW